MLVVSIPSSGLGRFSEGEGEEGAMVGGALGLVGEEGEEDTGGDTSTRTGEEGEVNTAGQTSINRLRRESGIDGKDVTEDKFFTTPTFTASCSA